MWEGSAQRTSPRHPHPQLLLLNTSPQSEQLQSRGRQSTATDPAGSNMASWKTVFYLGVCVSAWITAAPDEDAALKAQNVRWVSLDFKTVLTWTTKPSQYMYSVRYSWADHDWEESPDCTQVSDSECDLTNYLQDFDRTYSADILTERDDVDHLYDLEQLPHTVSPHFNPYRESNISAVKFTVEAVDNSRVAVNITDPLTSIHRRGKQLSIREVFKNDLKYKISYWKSGSTGKRDVISDSSKVEVTGLDAGVSYCFMVAAYIPSRPKTTQQGAWSKQQCTHGHNGDLDENIGAWVGAVFGLVAVITIVVVVSILCCRQRNKRLRTPEPSGPV